MFRLIKLPLLLVSVAPLLIASFAFNFNNFNVIYMLTGGGPRFADTTVDIGATDILITMVYKVAFGPGRTRDYGLASALLDPHLHHRGRRSRSSASGRPRHSRTELMTDQHQAPSADAGSGDGDRRRAATRTAPRSGPKAPSRRRSLRRWFKDTGWRHLVGVVVIVFAIFPLLYVLSASLNPQRHADRAPTRCSRRIGFDNYVRTVQRPAAALRRWFVNTLVDRRRDVASATVFLGALAAYAFSRMRFTGRRFGLLTLAAACRCSRSCSPSSRSSCC